ncbi:interleukin-2 receptor subunit beta isoform X1 [Mustela putorius furo]|uniref:Interleukin-2 receptor subunit beta n=3 Tax=Mustela putorius furo TaxID=9669 RepID=A0A8U0SRC2_MUSPF|nr:interleukin-2 receptor subunit beta isoform X1 [Mustela putorius furo]XP_044939843.1 interleukin-2 receptor subunit beta isoform X1 [Mustela putorius furo]
MAAPALSCYLSLLVFPLALAIPQGFTATDADTPKLTCFYNSKANISCAWNWDGDPQASSCKIHAWPDRRPWNRSCELLPLSPALWVCHLILGSPDAQSLTAADIVKMSVICHEAGRWRTLMTQDFKPFESLRLMAPDLLQITHVGTHKCNITWKVPQSSHYIESYLEFEARTRSPGHSWEEASVLILRQNQQWICLETLTPGTLYEFQVRVRAHLGSHKAWSPWSQPLAFRTRPAGERTLPFPWFGHVIVGISSVFVFLVLVYLLANCPYIGPWLKKVLKCHIPDPSEFFSQLKSEHGGDFQKWLSSPFPSSSFSPNTQAPEISPLEVLDRDTKATQLLLLQQKGPSPSAETSGHSLTSCFTNQGYFFFQLPDALEIEACQVYFSYDPCTEESEDGGAGAPEGSLLSPLPPLPPLPGEDDAYCTFPPGDDLLLFSPRLLGGPGAPNTMARGTGACEEKLPSSLQEGAPRDWAPQALVPPNPGASDPGDSQPPLERALGEAREEVPAPGPREGIGFPWARPPGRGQVGTPASCLTLNTDAYVSLQELQEQDPAHLV